MTITPELNSHCERIANYLYTDLGIAPESIDSDDVEEAMRDLYFKPYTKSCFRDNFGIKMNLFVRIVEHAWGIDSYH